MGAPISRLSGRKQYIFRARFTDNFITKKVSKESEQCRILVGKGMAHRVIKTTWIHDEKLEIVAYWKPGQGIPMEIVDECFSTMDEAKKLPGIGWQRVQTNKQIEGRGRKESKWISDERDLLATWNLSLIHI